MKNKWIALIGLLAILLLALPMLVACDGDDTGGTPSGTDTPSEVTIIIGEIVDLTGVAAEAMDKIDKALKDLAVYYNEENLIPGVTLEVKHYDDEYDPARDIPGYNYLKSKGADVFFTPVSAAASVVKPFCKQDKNVMFTVAPDPVSFDPPGWVFAAGQTGANWEIQTMLKWIAENDWDYEANGPAKIGGAMWAEAFGEGCMDGLTTYCNAHPEQFEIVKTLLPDIKFSWATEVEELKDCDYILPPVPMNNFAKQFRDAGYETTYIGTDAHIAFLEMISQQGLWESFDGMVLIKPALWWTDDDPIITLTENLLQRYRPGETEEIKKAGVAYLAVQQITVIYELIKATVEEVGAENFSSEALYNTAQSFTIEIGGCPHSYGPNKVTSSDGLAIYKVDGSATELIDKIYRADPNWLPVVYEP